MSITWANLAWLIWAALMLVAAGAAVLTTARQGARGSVIGVAMVAGAFMMFGFVSAITGVYEMEGYAQTSGFWIAMAIGLAGAGLLGFGLKRGTGGRHNSNQASLNR